jgi:hypothetical protein
MPKFKFALAAAVFVGGTSAAAAFCEVPSSNRYAPGYVDDEEDYYDCKRKEQDQQLIEERAKEREEIPPLSNLHEDD